jgi:hypothetical protein
VAKSSKRGTDVGNLVVAPSSNVVEVSIPQSVAYDFDKFVAVQKDILGRLGCLACCSGWDIRFDIQRRFVVDEKLKVQEVPGTL